MTAADPGRSPASLFLEYYAQAGSWGASARATAVRPDISFDTVADRLLKEDDANRAHDQLRMLVEAGRHSDAEKRGRIGAAMRSIDRALLEIHPRAVIGSASRRPATWLQDARIERRMTGEYLRNKSVRLIPRGPLLREPRHEHASSGDQLSDYFSAIAVAPVAFVHDSLTLPIRVVVVDTDPLSGVAPASSPGAERIGFLPLATHPGHIECEGALRSGRMFAAYRPAPRFDAGTAAIEGLRALGDVDIAIMPELGFLESHADALALALAAETAPMPRLIVAATYSTSLVNADGQPWNECRILNGRGAVLWRQRKIWPAGISQDRAIELGLPDPGSGTLTLEDNASGAELVIADIDGLGRCVVLICQDCTIPALGTALYGSYQPDWVFTPIFDKTIDPGRWAHAAAFGASNLSQARGIAITHTGHAPAGANMGLAVGPKECPPGCGLDLDRAVRLVTKPASGPMIAELRWRNGHWHQTMLGTKAPAC